MKIRNFPILLPFVAIIAGIAGWFSYPALLEFVAAPIKQTLVPSMPSESFFHRLQTAGAFSVLGILIPIAAILTSQSISRISIGRSLGIMTVLSILIAIPTAWVLNANFAFASEFIAELEAKNPGVPTVASLSMISLHRVAIYPSLVMLLVIATMSFRIFKSKSKINEEGQQVAS